MSLEATLEDGRGSGRKVSVEIDNSMLVTPTGIPPIEASNDIRIFRQYLTDDGLPSGSNDMRVAGTLATPLDFYVTAPSDGDRYIDSISVVIADAGAVLNKFGNITALTNGIELSYEDEVLGNVVIHEGLKSNFDLVRLCGVGSSPVGSGTNSYRASNVEGNSEGYIMTLDFSETFGLPWGLRLAKDTNLKIKFSIRDDTTGVDAINVIAYGYDRIIDNV